MYTKRSVGRWSLTLGVAAVVAIGCATAPEEVALVSASPDAAKPAAKAPVRDAARPIDSTVPSVPDASADDASSATDANVGADAGLFAGEPFDPAPELAVGATCPTENDLVARRCGKCGTQQTLCKKQLDGSLKVGAYGACRNENTSANACLPNAQRLGVACGLCGKTLQTCDVATSCEWTDVSCENEVAAGCTAGDVRYVALACTGDLVQRQQCMGTCTWAAPEACAARGPDELVLPGSTGVTVKKDVTLWGASQRALALGTCPTTLTAASGNAQYTKIRNPGATAVAVNLWASKAAGSALPDMVMTVYNRATIPAADADRIACAGKVVAAGTGFLGANAVSIPAGGDILVMVSSKGAGSVDAPFVLNAQLESPMTVPSAVGVTVEGEYVVRAAGPAMPRSDGGTCPTDIDSDEDYQFTFVTLKNPGASVANLTVGANLPPPATVGDLTIAVYAAPPTATTVDACIGSSNDGCSISSFSIDACTDNIPVPAGGQVTVMVANYYRESVDIPFTLKVRRK